MRNAIHPRSPALYGALAFSAGILLAWRLWRPPLWWAAAACGFVAAALLLRRRPRAALAAALCALATLGALSWAARSDEWSGALRAQGMITPFLDGSEITVTAHVVRDGLVRNSATDTRQMVDVETEELQATADGRRSTAGAGIRLTVYSREETEDEEGQQTNPARQLVYGQRLRFTAKLREPRNFGNPGAWDYRAYLAAQGMTALASVRAGRLQLLPGFSGSRLAQWRSRARRHVLARVHALWDARRAALIDAMLIGDKAGIDRQTRIDFQRTGVFHILVVSGMNVGILAFVVFWVLRRLRVGELLCSAATVVLSLGYAALTDGGAPILRATFMLAIYLGTRLLYRDRALLNAIGVAGLLLLAVDPRALFDASFQLTFLSVLAIAGIGVPLLERTSEPYRRALHELNSVGYDPAFPPRVCQFRLDLRLIAGRLAQFVGERVSDLLLRGSATAALYAYDVLVISAVAQVGLALPMAIYFHRATVVGLPANVLVVPLTGVLMPAATAAVALDHISPWLAKPAALVSAWSLDGITGSVRLLGGFRAADLRVPSPAWGAIVFAAAAFVFCVWASRQRRIVTAAGLAALVASAAWLALMPPRPQVEPGVLEVTAIDVGQADSTLIITPQGKSLLVDAAGSLGPAHSEFDFGEDVIAPYLWSRGITHLDAVALTHAHADHMGGMAGVIANFRPRQLWLGPNPQTPALALLLQHAAARNVAVVPRAGGDKFDFGGAQVEVLSPPRDWQLAAKPRNNDSLVLRISFRHTAALLEGDAEKKMERMLVELQPRASLLKVAHNGSATSSAPELLDAVRPSMAVISVGYRNSFRHPRPEVLQRLATRHIVTLRTDTAGAVSFYLDGETVRRARPATLPR